MQSPCANRLDVQSVALQSGIRRAIAFKDPKAYSRPSQPLRQAQPTNPAAYDKNVQRPRYLRRRVNVAHLPLPFLGRIRTRSSCAKATDALWGRRLAPFTAAMTSSTTSSIAMPGIQSPLSAPLAKTFLSAARQPASRVSIMCATAESEIEGLHRQ